MGTENDAGIKNLGLFFSVIHVGANPPMLGLLFRPHTVPRHSLENFRFSGYATLNSVHPDLLEKAHAASANFAADQSEFEELNIDWEKKGEFKAPFVRDSKVKIGISYLEEHHIKANDTIFVVGKIEEVHLTEDFRLEDGLLDHSLAETLSVNGLDSYYLPQRFERYAYARPNEELKKLKWSKE